MKCKRCGRDMERRKSKKGYTYVCTYCGFTIGGKRTDTHSAETENTETHKSAS